MLLWILWLIQHSICCVNVIINYDSLDQLPEDRSMLYQLRGYDQNNESDADADAGGSNPDPEQGNAAGDTEGNETTHVKEVRAVPDPG